MPGIPAVGDGCKEPQRGDDVVDLGPLETLEAERLGEIRRWS